MLPLGDYQKNSCKMLHFNSQTYGLLQSLYEKTRDICFVKAGKQLRQLFTLQEADMFSTAFPQPERIEEGRAMLDQIINQKEIYKPPMLAINGNDLKTIGFQEGKELGACLEALYEYCLEYPEENSKERLLSLAKQWKKGGVFHG